MRTARQVITLRESSIYHRQVSEDRMSGFEETVERGKTVTISEADGDLILEGCTVIPSGVKVVVHGTLVVRGRSTVKGSLKAEEVRGSGDLLVEGGLEASDVRLDNGASLDVKGDFRADDVDVPNSIRVGGRTEVSDMRVGGTAVLTGDAKVEDAKVGGTLEARAKLESDEVRVGGTLQVKVLISCDVRVGGNLRAGTIKAEDVDVGGTVEVSGGVNIGNLTVGGTAAVGGGEVEDVRVGGILRSVGELVFEEIRVGGQLTIGSGKGEKVSIGGILEVATDMKLEDKLSVGGNAMIGGALEAGSIGVGGNLEAAKAVADDRLEIGGMLSTSAGSRAREVDISRGARVRGPIVGETVRIKENAEVEDVYADSLWAEANCSLRNIYVRRAEVGRGCKVSGRLEYTEALHLGKDITLANQPEKVPGLPNPPI